MIGFRSSRSFGTRKRMELGWDWKMVRLGMRVKGHMRERERERYLAGVARLLIPSHGLSIHVYYVYLLLSSLPPPALLPVPCVCTVCCLRKWAENEAGISRIVLSFEIWSDTLQCVRAKTAAVDGPVNEYMLSTGSNFAPGYQFTDSRQENERHQNHAALLSFSFLSCLSVWHRNVKKAMCIRSQSTFCVYLLLIRLLDPGSSPLPLICSATSSFCVEEKRDSFPFFMHISSFSSTGLTNG